MYHMEILEAGSSKFGEGWDYILQNRILYVKDVQLLDKVWIKIHVKQQKVIRAFHFIYYQYKVSVYNRVLW